MFALFGLAIRDIKATVEDPKVVSVRKVLRGVVKHQYALGLSTLG